MKISGDLQYDNLQVQRKRSKACENTKYDACVRVTVQQIINSHPHTHCTNSFDTHIL